MEAMAAFCAVQFLFAADGEITRLLSLSNIVFQLSNFIEPSLGIGNLFSMIGGWIFDLASGKGELAETSGKLGFYLMTPLALASLRDFAARVGGSLRGAVAFSSSALAYFALYGAGFFFFAVLWPAFLWAILFKIPVHWGEPYLTLRRDTWRATLACVATVTLALLAELL